MNSVKFNNSFLHMNVLCLKQHLGYTLAGIGSNLFVFENATLLLSEPIFVGERVHGIYIKNSLIILKGAKQLSLVKLEVSKEFKCKIIIKIQSSDWIQDVIAFKNLTIGLVTAHNAFEWWSLKSGKHLSTWSCAETCILYCSKTTGDCMENITVFAGTVFGEVFIWAPSLEKGSLLQRLKGHNGAVFSIELEPKEKLLTTTSDDRSLKVWSVVSSCPLGDPNSWKNANIHLVHTLFGHTARVWRSIILPSFYFSIGEDSQLIVWTKDGRMIKAFTLHQESGITAVEFSVKTNAVTTGGEDGGINTFSLKHLLIDVEAKKILHLGQSSSTKVCFTKNGLVYTLNGACAIMSDAGKEIVYESERFRPYCVLEVSSGGDYVIMGSITGDVVVIHSETKRVVSEGKVSNGRVYSIHWIDPFVLTCGPDGTLTVWELSTGVLQKINTILLPNCRERWTTCGAIHGGKLVLGDRMGGVHVYDLNEGNGRGPLKSFHKIHSYLGVTDIKSIGSACLSIGRDGTVKEFAADLTLSTTHKLPMEWPWKILKYDSDILILGFHSVNFNVWSTKAREILASHDCGGGHRSCDYRLHENKLSFVYVKGKQVFIAVLILDEIIRLRNGFHGREINCLRILKREPTIVVTGSEDTTLRVSMINRSDVHQVQVLKTHVSSIRALSACWTDSGKAMMVSVGGKGQMVVWDLDLSAVKVKCREVVNHRLRKEDRHWKRPELSVEPETRIMCADIKKLGNGFLIAVGCSDRWIRIFSYSGELRQLSAIPYTHCILQVVVVEVGLSRTLVSMGTDGRAVFWDVTDCSGVGQLGCFHLHQSGINSFHLEQIAYGKFILATGGDDNVISVAFVEIDGKEVTLRRVWENRTSHSCQVTGIKMLKNLLVTTSVDQRITVWKWSWQEGKFTGEFLDQHVTAVPDVQGLDAMWRDNSTVMVTVFGKGLEIYQIHVLCT